MTDQPTVLVSMPYLPSTCSEFVADAVDSVLRQDRVEVKLVVVNDGGGPEAWDPLSTVTDNRLVRFDLPRQRGRYFADAVTLAACPHPWWTPHDSDDVSDRQRLHKMMTTARRDNADLVMGSYTMGINRNSPRSLPDRNRARATRNGGRLVHISSHTSLWRTEALRSIGGPHPDFLVAYDTLMVALGTRHLRWSVCNDATYYWRNGHRTQLTHDPDTGMISQHRKDAWKRREKMWEECTSLERTRQVCAPDPELAAEVAHHAERLRGLLS